MTKREEFEYLILSYVSRTKNDGIEENQLNQAFIKIVGSVDEGGQLFNEMADEGLLDFIKYDEGDIYSNTTKGQLRLFDLEKKYIEEKRAFSDGRKIENWTIIAAIAGIVAAIAALYGIWLAYHPPH